MTGLRIPTGTHTGRSHKTLVVVKKSHHKKSPKYVIERNIGFAKLRRVKLRLVGQENLSSSTAAYAYQPIWANSIYQPLIGTPNTTALEPSGYTQWNTFYNDYCVTSTTIKVWFTSNGSSSQTNAGMVGVLLSDSSTVSGVSTDPCILMNDPKSRYKMMGTQASGHEQAIVKHSYSAKKFFGVKNTIDNREELGAGFGNHPAEGAFFHIFMYCNNVTATSLPAVTMWYQITYNCILGSPKDISISKV